MRPRRKEDWLDEGEPMSVGRALLFTVVIVAVVAALLWFGAIQ